MSIMSWNVRGLGNKETVRALKNTSFKYKPGIIFLSETKKKKRYLEKIRMKMKMTEYFYVEPVGIAGGLALWWSNEADISVLSFGKNFIDTKVSLNGEEDWFLTFIYGPPYTEEKQTFWESLASLRNNNEKKWCLIGDSNVVARPEEKLGGLTFDASSAKWFHDFTDALCLIELPLKGGTFTWSNQRSEDDAILEKLDRIIVSLEWSSSFPKAIGVLDATITSDHAPIFLFLKGMTKKYKKDFKFEAKWILEDECSAKVKDSWLQTGNCNGISGFGRKLRRTRIQLRQWSKMKKGTGKLKEEEMKEKIRFMQGKQLSKSGG
ncbi:hypothetical protein V6N12_019963 [Hibiscus sabdariffa]|uniref:Endonuclease/exonuclease/phosphatase domain-containing protein n=1 Tax=Hibiscus sabdariffa TaxID=183260 RepID=A0ABR2BGG2_9ROSI